MPTLKLPGFLGGSYTPRSYRAEVEKSVNLYPEVIESKQGENVGFLNRRPALQIFAQDETPEGKACRALYLEPAQNRLFAIIGTTLYEVGSSGALANRGTVAVNDLPPTITGNGQGGGQLGICSGGEFYVLELATDTFHHVTVGIISDLLMCAFSDGYFLVLNDQGTLQWSAPEDGLTWDGLDIAKRSTTPDPWVSMLVNHREVWLWGGQTGEVWTNTGNVDGPFEFVQGSLFQQGVVAAFTAQVFDNSAVWLGQSTSGALSVWRANAYTPSRLSTHSLEFVLDGMQALGVDFAQWTAWTMQIEGHTFYVLVPSGNGVYRASPVYDAESGLWMEWGLLYDDSTDPWVWLSMPVTCHAYAFGFHLVGDAGTGTIYALTLDASQDNLAWT